MRPSSTGTHASPADDTETERPPQLRDGHRSTLARRVGLGAVGGLVATVTMSTFRLPISESPPPTSVLWAKYVMGGDPEEHTLVGLLLHLCYGVGGGVVYAALTPIPAARHDRAQEERGVLTGLGYGLLLSVFGEHALLGWLLELDLSRDERFVFHVSHVVYGLTLGAWVGSKLE